MLNLFIGALLGTIAYYIGVDYAIAVGFFMLILNPRARARRVEYVPNQKPLFEKILQQKVEKYSDEIIGMYNNNPIHEYIVVKNPVNGVCYRHDYFDIIYYNKRGQIIFLPEPGEVFLPTGLVYKDTGQVVEINPQK